MNKYKKEKISKIWFKVNEIMSMIKDNTCGCWWGGKELDTLEEIYNHYKNDEIAEAIFNAIKNRGK